MAIKFKRLNSFSYARCHISHGMHDGIAVLRLDHQRRGNHNEPWRDTDQDYVIAGTKKDFFVKCESDVPAMVEAFKAGKKSFKL